MQWPQKILLATLFFYVNLINSVEATPLKTKETNKNSFKYPVLNQKNLIFNSQVVQGTNLPLSPGDKIKIMIQGEGGEIFSGNYQVNLYGDIELPYLDSIRVRGLDVREVREKLKDILLSKQFFRPELLQVSVQVLSFGPIQVNVNGAVFEPGRIVINDRESNESNFVDDIVGDNPLDRYLTNALKLAGGVKPTADLSRTEIIRSGKKYKTVDLYGIFSSKTIEDIPLIDGDVVIVHSKKEFQIELIRPSPITPDEIPLFIANLTDPSGGRALEGASRISETNFDYGTRLSNILITAQCLGGNFIEGDRSALLIRTDSVTQEVITLDNSVEEIITNSSAQAEINPFLMPNDGIACYDSDLNNTAGFFQFLSTILSPFSVFSNILNNFDNFFGGNNRR